MKLKHFNKTVTATIEFTREEYVKYREMVVHDRANRLGVVLDQYPVSEQTVAITFTLPELLRFREAIPHDHLPELNKIIGDAFVAEKAL